MMEDSPGKLFPIFVNSCEMFSGWWLAGMLMLSGDWSTPGLVSHENWPPGGGPLYCHRRSAPILFASLDGPAVARLALGLEAADIAKKAPYWQNKLQSLYGYIARRWDCFSALDTNTNYLRASDGHRATNQPSSRIRAILERAQRKKKGRAHCAGSNENKSENENENGIIVLY